MSEDIDTRKSVLLKRPTYFRLRRAKNTKESFDKQINGLLSLKDYVSQVIAELDNK